MTCQPNNKVIIKDVNQEALKMGKVYKVRDETAEALQKNSMKLTVKSQTFVKESELINILVWKNLKDIGTEDVEKYRKEVLKKEDWIVKTTPMSQERTIKGGTL